MKMYIKFIPQKIYKFCSFIFQSSKCMKTGTYKLLVQSITNFQSTLTARYLTQPSVKFCPILRPMQKFNKIKHLTVKSF
jgi:hypothetical protein